MCLTLTQRSCSSKWRVWIFIQTGCNPRAVWPNILATCCFRRNIQIKYKLFGNRDGGVSRLQKTSVRRSGKGVLLLDASSVCAQRLGSESEQHVQYFLTKAKHDPEILGRGQQHSGGVQALLQSEVWAHSVLQKHRSAAALFSHPKINTYKRNSEDVTTTD